MTNLHSSFSSCYIAFGYGVQFFKANKLLSVNVLVALPYIYNSSCSIPTENQIYPLQNLSPVYLQIDSYPASGCRWLAPARSSFKPMHLGSLNAWVDWSAEQPKLRQDATLQFVYVKEITGGQITFGKLYIII